MNNNQKIGKFISVHKRVLREIFSQDAKGSLILFLLSIIAIFPDFIYLKIIEYVTNVVANISNIEDMLALYGGKILCLVLIFLFVHVMKALYNIKYQKYSMKIAARIEKNLVDHVSDIDYDYFENTEFYEKINLTKKAYTEYGKALQAITQCLQICVMLTVYTYMLRYINIFFIGIIMAIIIVSSIVAAQVTDRQLEYWRKHVSPEERRRSYFQKIYSNRIQHANNQTNRSLSFFVNKYERYMKRERKGYIYLNLFSFSTDFIASALFLIVFLITILMVGQMVISEQKDIGYFTMVITMLINLYATVKTYILFLMNSNWYVKVIDEYYSIMDTPVRDKEKKLRNDKNGELFIRDLWYQYPQVSAPVICGVNIHFRMGEKVMLVGYNGSGKTTLMSLVAGLLQNYDGEIQRDHMKIKMLNQEFGQYPMTIRQNIALGCENLSDEKLDRIIRQVGLEEVIKSLPDGVDSMLGKLENGIELSQGQWQRIAIGRLIADETANVWVLDEPTAHLDPLSEIDLYKMILNVSGKRLVLFVSHRLGFARYADRIMVMNSGKIVEEGTHDELIKQEKGLYARIYEAQKYWYHL